MNFETIKRNYTRGLWTKALVRMAVRKGVISKAQYGEIVGEDYTTGEKLGAEDDAGVAQNEVK